MTVTQDVVRVLFFAGLLLNTLVLVPKAMRIWRHKSLTGISCSSLLLMFFIQFTIVLHGLNDNDLLLSGGYFASMIATIIVLALYFKVRLSQKCFVDLSAEEILEQLPCYIFWKDREGKYIGFNRQARDFFGISRSRKEVSPYEILSQEQADTVRRVDEEVLYKEQSAVVELEASKDGEEVVYRAHKNPMRNRKNEVVGILAVSMDVTQCRKKVLDGMLTLENIIVAMPGYVFWLDENGCYLGCNDNHARWLGFESRQELVGKRHEDCMHSSGLQQFVAYNKQVLGSGLPLTVDELVQLSDGSPATFLTRRVPLRNSQGGVSGVFGVSYDITDRIAQREELIAAKEIAERANQAKSQFVSNMEHDIRTPFAGIYGVVNVLLDQEHDPEKHSLLTDISLCTKELMDYCDRILSFSQIESGDMPRIDKTFRLRKLVDSVMAIESVVAKHKGLDFSLEYDDRLPEFVITDSYRVKSVLINLLSNAVKFTAAGFVKLSFSLDREEDQGRNIVVKMVVSDSGIGIPKDKKAFIFDRFTRVDASNRGRYRGLGLGLKIVKQFVAELDGDIHLDSNIGEGTVFTVFLRFKQPLSTAGLD